MEQLDETIVITDSIRECIYDLYTSPAVYGVMPIQSSTSSSTCETKPSTLTCKDGTKITTPDFKKAFNAYTAAESRCITENSKKFIEEIKKECYPEEFSSSSLSATSSDSQD